MDRMSFARSRVFLLCVFTMILGSVITTGCSSVSFSPPSQEEPKREPSLVYQRGQQLFEAGQFQEAIAMWERVSPTAPEYIDAQLAIRQARLRIQELTEEEVSSSETSTQLDVYVERAEALEREGQVREALKLYEEARQLDPQNALLHQKIEELHLVLEDAAERHKALGELYLSQGAYQKARAEWEGLLELDPANELAKQRLADLEVLTATSDRVFLQRGRSLVGRGLVNNAREEFAKALRVDPQNEQTLNYLSTLEHIPFTMYTVEKGDTLSSIAARYTKNPSDYRILADFNQLADKAQLRIGQQLKIPHILQFHEALSPNEEDPLKNMASSDAQGENPAEVRDITPIPETEMTEELQQLFNEGVSAYNQGNFRDALALFNQVYERNPHDVDVYDYIVRSIANLRGSAPGEESNIALAPETHNTETPLNMSEVENLLASAKMYREAGNLKKSVAIYEQALRLEPGNSDIVRELEQTRDDIRKLITTHLNEGIKLFNQEALEEAILEWEKVIELDPENLQAANYRTQAEKRLNALKKTK